jgi:hypothetical protein
MPFRSAGSPGGAVQALALELVAGRVLHQERHELLQRRVG